MSIIIKNMKMPNACYECVLSDTCDLPSPYYVEPTRANGCPLQEIILCKDCVHHKPFLGAYQCSVFDWINTEDDYCSFAEREKK